MCSVESSPASPDQRLQVAQLKRRFGASPFTTAEAETAGLTIWQLRRLVGRALLTCVLHGVYQLGPLTNEPADRARIGALALPPGGAVVRRTAAWMYGVDARGPGEQGVPMPVECVVSRGITPVRRPGLKCYQADLEPSDIVDVRGVPCTTPARTVADLLRWISPPMGLACADAFAAGKLIKPDEILTMLGRWPGGRFIGQARRLAGFIEPLAESFAESWLRLRLLDAGFPRPTAQVAILDETGRVVYRLDLGWPERRIGIEYDGQEFHSSRGAILADIRRREILAERFGWHVVGVGKGEVLGRSLDLEKGVGELLGLEPIISRRMW
jgi:hypothetical protein